MALMPEPQKLPAKDTTPLVPRTVKYRVLERTFHLGAIADPFDSDGKPNFVMGPPGLHGGPLEQVEPPYVEPKGKSAA